jgi:hypothetical protein
MRLGKILKKTTTTKIKRKTLKKTLLDHPLAFLQVYRMSQKRHHYFAVGAAPSLDLGGDGTR